MLKRVSIQNFKSLKDVTLDLQKVNLLIGPNNSGKTNFLKALETFTVGGLHSQNVQDLISISYKHQQVPVVWKFEYIPDPNSYMSKKYDKGNINTYHEKLTYEVKASGDMFSAQTSHDRWFSDENDVRMSTEIRSGHIEEFFEYVRSKVFRPDPSRLIHSATLAGKSVDLSPDGSNLIEFYFFVFNNYEERGIRIQSDLSSCIPEISRFRTPPIEGENKIGLKFFDKSGDSYWANEVSEGVLYFLILLCIINQPNPPKLLLLEEPEKGIHPRRIWEVIKFIFQLAEEKDVQIIMTTHNEHVVNAFSSMPESIFVFDKDEETGVTTVRNLQKEIIEPSHRLSKNLGQREIDFTSDLGEKWMYGLIGGVPADEL